MGQRFKVCFDIDVESIDGEMNVIDTADACEKFIVDNIMNNLRKSVLANMRGKLVHGLPIDAPENRDYYIDTLTLAVTRQAVHNITVCEAHGAINPDKIDMKYN